MDAKLITPNTLDIPGTWLRRRFPVAAQSVCPAAVFERHRKRFNIRRQVRMELKSQVQFMPGAGLARYFVTHCGSLAVIRLSTGQLGVFRQYVARRPAASSLRNS